MSSKSSILVVCGVVAVIVIALAAWFVLGVLSILGPLDSPRFEQKDWEKLYVRYRLVLENNKEDYRYVTFSGNELAELKKLFSTKESRGVSTPCPDLLNLQLTNGEIWQIQFGTANSLRFCNASDTYYAYRIELHNTEFYQRLRQLCLENEQQQLPECQLENISICTNRRHVKTPEPAVVQAGFIEVGSWGELAEVCVPFIFPKEDIAPENEDSLDRDNHAMTDAS